MKVKRSAAPKKSYLKETTSQAQRIYDNFAKILSKRFTVREQDTSNGKFVGMHGASFELATLRRRQQHLEDRLPLNGEKRKTEEGFRL